MSMPRAVRTASATSHLVRLPARSRTPGRTSYAAGQAIEETVQLASQQMREVIAALQAFRGIAKVSAVTIVAELGELSRFGEVRQLMADSGTVATGTLERRAPQK